MQIAHYEARQGHMKDALSYEQVRDGVRDAINAHPEGVDYVYELPDLESGVCLYVNEGKPSCIVGHYLINILGVAKHAVRAHEGVNASTLAEALHSEGVMPAMDYWAATFLDVLQREQDSGATWGEAYEYASDHAESRRMVYRETFDKQ
jgi:hypothetical protein